MQSELLAHFKSQWNFVRGLTLDLLESLSNEELSQSPAASLGPWWKQFRHMGRVQENYLQAVRTGVVKFEVEGGTYDGGISRNRLSDYLQALDLELLGLLDSATLQREVDWFGEKKSIAQHFLYLADHETLHHGQWIVYRKLLSGKFPESWSAWGL